MGLLAIEFGRYFQPQRLFHSGFFNAFSVRFFPLFLPPRLYKMFLTTFSEGAYMKTLAKQPKTITFSLPSDAGQEIKAAAKKEHRSVSELLLDTFHRYQAKKEFHELAARTQKYVKKMKLTPKDFGGPFAE
jgi:hypothetical protein